MIRKLLFVFFFQYQLIPVCRSQGNSGTLDVVSWNLEFFGAPGSGPADDDLQEENAKKILRWLDADLYGMIEIVDTMRFRRLVDSLGNNEYGLFIAPYCSGNTTGTGSGWINGQKLAYIYKKSVFSNVLVNGIMRNSASAYTNWAAGRFPFMFSATATINGINRNVVFFLLHGKAGSTQDDYLKRANACVEFKDSLDTYFYATNSFIIGDFNDALHQTIYPGATLSSYHALVADSIDSDHYKSITLPLAVAGQSSMINFPNVIDNHIISNELGPYYIQASAQIKTDVITVVPDYVTAHNTSDHYPVLSRYNLNGIPTGVSDIHPSESGIRIAPNPVQNLLTIHLTKPQANFSLQLYTLQGQIVWEINAGYLSNGAVLMESMQNLPPGIYYLKAVTKEYRTIFKLVHL